MEDNISVIEYSKCACVVYLNDIPLPSYYQIISVQVKQAFQHITSAQIYIKQDVGFFDPIISDPLNKAHLAGDEITIKAQQHNGDDIILFEGYIVKHKYKNSTKGVRLNLTAQNKVVAMFMVNKPEIYYEQTDKDIMESICESYGMRLRLDEKTHSQLRVRHTQCVKYQVSDWDFINLKAEVNGCFIYSENDVVQVVYPKLEANPLDMFTVRYGENVYEVELEEDGRANNIENELISFNLNTLEPFLSPDEELAPAGLPPIINGNETSINYRTFNELEAQNLLDAKNQLKSISRFNGWVHTHANLKPKPGDTLKIEGFNELTDQKCIITSVMQDYSDGGFSTYIQFGLNHQSFASRFIENKSPKRPLMISGIVRQLENDPDNLFRILVHIPLWGDVQGVWARHITSYAGQDYGLVLLPEIGDEVLLSFIGDDFDEPLIIGSVFNPAKPPFASYQDDNHVKAFVTRKGMKWSWNDEKGIHEISTPNGNTILLSEEDHSIRVSDENGNIIEMTKSKVNIEGQADLTIKAARQIKIEAPNIEINASATNSIKGGLVQIN